jgi:amino acid transporter
MTASPLAERVASRPRRRTAAILVAAVIVAIAVNVVIAAVAVAAGAPSTYGPLTFPAYALFTTLGIAGGWAGWVLVHRRARDPRRTLRVLVPVLTLVSFVPDVLLLAFRFIPGTTTAGVIALMLMHLVVVAVAVPAYALAMRSRSEAPGA